MKELSETIKKILLQSLQDEDSFTAEEIKLTESKMVESVVYNSYKPVVYSRRGEKGGLADTDNMKHSVRQEKNKVVLNVVNLTPQNNKFYNVKDDKYYQASNVTLKKDGDLARLVEGGHNNNGLKYTFLKYGDNGVEAPYMEPRPFQQQTIKELQSNGRHVEGLAKDLEKRGIKTKKL